MKNSEEIFSIIVANIDLLVPELENKNIQRSSMCSPLGLDSIGKAELIEKTLEDLNLEMSHHELQAARNLGDLADLLAKKYNSRYEFGV